MAGHVRERKAAEEWRLPIGIPRPQWCTLEPRLLIDNKDKAAITEGDIRKLIRDAKERHAPVGVIVTKDETQLRQVDRDCRWSQQDGIWVLRTTRQWFRRDLDVLRPLLERMRTEGTDFLQHNAALGEEIRRTLVDLDEVEKELKKAAKSIDAASWADGQIQSPLAVPLRRHDGAEEDDKAPSGGRQ